MAKLEDERYSGSSDDENQEHSPKKNPLAQELNQGDQEESRSNSPTLNPTPPSPWKRTAFAALIILLFYLGLRAALLQEKKPKVIYASRYSKEHKFRPAASPIITETLKDGRVRLRGALPSPTPTPSPSKPPVKKRRPNGGKARRKSPKVALQ